MSELKMKKNKPEIPKITQRKWDSKVSPFGIDADSRAKLNALRSEGNVEADILREAVRQYLAQFFE
jgi:hypothetical protein